MASQKMSIERMNTAAGEATAVLRALANESRLLLLCQLSNGELCVSDLEERLDIHQPTLSQQLGVLRTEGLVTTRREGKKIFYSIRDARILTLLRTMYEVFCPKAERG